MRVQQNKLKVIIADSSNFSRLILSDMVQAQPDLEVLETAADGAGLLNALRLHRPDVVIADYNLPENRHAVIFRQIFTLTGIPILMVLNRSQNAEFLISEMAQLGVYDYFVKPDYRLQPQLRSMQVEILAKIRAVSKSMSREISFHNSTVLAEKLNVNTAPIIPKNIVVIGASTGGTLAVEKLVAGLDKNLDACILIAVHLPAGFTTTFAKRLQFHTPLKVVEASSRTELSPGKIIIAPGGKNMIIRPGIRENVSARICFSAAENDQYDLPSINLLMNSVALLFGDKTLGIILTGMGEDGTLGMINIQAYGGTTIAQSRASSAIFGMAKSAIDHNCVTEVKDLAEIPGFINRFVARLAPAPGNFNRVAFR